MFKLKKYGLFQVSVCTSCSVSNANIQNGSVLSIHLVPKLLLTCPATPFNTGVLTFR